MTTSSKTNKEMKPINTDKLREEFYNELVVSRDLGYLFAWIDKALQEVVKEERERIAKKYGFSLDKSIDYMIDYFLEELKNK